MTAFFITVVSAYLMGSVSTSIILSRLLPGGDVRDHGSGNAGATNMARVYGLRAGILVLCGDMLKTGLSVLVGWLMCGGIGIIAAGCGCVVGHCFPVYYGFRGGKGVSVAGVLGFCVDWRVGLAVVLCFFIAAVLSKKVSVGSLTGAAVLIVSAFIFAVPAGSLALALTVALLVIFQHRGNILRLINGTEPDFRAK